MFPCAYCERPLTCDACGVPYSPPSAEEYAALSRADVPLACPDCERPLVCRWCKMPYDGRGEGDDEDWGDSSGRE